MYTATFLLLATATLVFAGPKYKQKPDYKKRFSLGSDGIGSGPVLRRRFSSATLGSTGRDVDLGRAVAVDFGGDGFSSAGSNLDVLGSGAPYYEGSDIIRKYKPIIGTGGRVSAGSSRLRRGGRFDLGRPYPETSYPLPVDLGDGIGNGPYPTTSRYEPIAVGGNVPDTRYPLFSKYDPIDYGYGDGLPISSTDSAIVNAGASSTSSGPFSAGLSARDVLVKRKNPVVSPYQRRHSQAIVDVGAADSVLSGVGGAVDVIRSSRKFPYALRSGPAVADVGAADSGFSGVGGAVDVIGSYSSQKRFGRPRGLRSSRLSLGVPSAVSRRSIIDFGDSGNFAGGTSFAASGRGAGRPVGSLVDYESIGKGSGTYYSKGRRHISQYVNGLDYGLSRDDIRFILKSKAFPSNMHIPKRRHIKW